jgi:YVTN family beta-propeller protein
MRFPAWAEHQTFLGGCGQNVSAGYPNGLDLHGGVTPDEVRARVGLPGFTSTSHRKEHRIVIGQIARAGGAAGLILLASSCSLLGGSTARQAASPAPHRHVTPRPTVSSPQVPSAIAKLDANPLPGMPPILNPLNIYAADTPENLTPAAKAARPLVYVPDTLSNDVYVIDQATDKVINHFAVGTEPQHVVPAYDGSVLWVTNDEGNSLTPINPVTGEPGPPVPVSDPYNLYFTPDGQHAIVVAEELKQLDFRDPHTMALQHSLPVPMCPGVDHMDFTANGRYLLASCEFAFQSGNRNGRLVVVNVATEQVAGTVTLPANSSPQDVVLSPDGTTFYVADLNLGGVWLVDAASMRLVGFIKTGAGAHGLNVSRDDKDLYVSDRDAGAVSVVSFATHAVVATWRIPGGGSPDMGNVSADGKTLWLSGRFNNVVYAFNTTTGQVTQIPVGQGPHGVCVWPQPGRYSLGHTGKMR